VTTKTAPRPGPSRGRRTTPAGRAKAERARAAAAQRRRNQLLVWGVALVVVSALVGVMMWSARATSDDTSHPAPEFALTDTSGATVRLADYRGRNVVLYFNEGAGCQSCLYQMADIERHAAQFTAANITVLPIVMNTAEQIKADMAANGVRTPFLIDTGGTVSKAYGTLGKGMHPGLPGHSFVLIDTDGIQRWYGEYPSMYLSPAELLNQIRTHLPS
jgi:peroxiredoxin